VVGSRSCRPHRFSSFLRERFPRLAPLVGSALIGKAEIIGSNPRIGAVVEGDEDYRRLVLRVLNAPYVLQYRIAKDRIVILRVFHGREARET
jgi:plasmid stabilization system protein ParE